MMLRVRYLTLDMASQRSPATKGCMLAALATGGRGVGSKHVALKWSDILFGRDGTSPLLTTNRTKESLKAVPDYEHERWRPGSRP